MTGPEVPGGGVPAAPKRVSSGRLLATLGGAGALAGALILVVFAATAPAIESHRARRLDSAIREVLRGPARYDTLYVVNGALQSEPVAGVERVYLGRDEAGAPAGFAIEAAAPGFADVIGVIFGYDPATRNVIGMKVLESKETPGLGDRIEKDSLWVAQFGGVLAPIEGVKPGRGRGAPQELDLITGATISTKTIVKMINDALARLDPALRAEAVAVGSAAAPERADSATLRRNR